MRVLKTHPLPNPSPSHKHSWALLKIISLLTDSAQPFHKFALSDPKPLALLNILSPA